MAIRSRRLKTLDGLRQAVSIRIRQRVDEEAQSAGNSAPEAYSELFTRIASNSAPGLVDRLLELEHLASQERGDVPHASSFHPPRSPMERRMRLLASL